MWLKSFVKCGALKPQKQKSKSNNKWVGNSPALFCLSGMHNPQKTFRANGKLMITGEYLALWGAKVLSVPTKLGQTLAVNCHLHHEKGVHIHWKSTDIKNQTWFSGAFSQPFSSTHTNPTEKNLGALLALAFDDRKLPDGLYQASTALEFPREWGLGSSSSLIALIAKWLQTDPYRLFYKTQNGSGYDVASAMHDTPIFFQKNNLSPVIESIHWTPPFADELAFVYLGKKQDSPKEVARFLSEKTPSKDVISEINDIALALPKCTTLQAFEALLVAHETIIGRLLQRPPIANAAFKGFPGLVKSLGAWGGDFVLISKRPGWQNWLQENGYQTIINWNDMILLTPTVEKGVQ
jgi:mevalonate kinase